VAAAHRLSTDRVPAPTLVVAAAVSVQCGAAIAVRLFTTVGPLGAVWIRLLLSALVMALVARPRLRAARLPAVRAAVAFGVVLAAMNTCFYFAIARVPLGAAVTVEFIGPLAVAVGGSRRLLDLAWVALAAAGVVLLAGLGADAASSGGARLDPVGLGLAASAGVCWSGYILLAKRVGRDFPGTTGLSLALIVGAVGLAPAALVRHAGMLGHPAIVAAGLGVAVLSSALPYSLELLALRRLSAGTFGVLLSLDPAVAALAGWVILGQHLGWSEWLAIGCVVVASAAASVTAPPEVTTPIAAEPPEAAPPSAVGAGRSPT
jgi:inner membrane transporter RhtA